MARCNRGRRRRDAAARVLEGRELARQLRRAGARRGSRGVLDSHGGDAESAAASGELVRRAHRLGAHEPLRVERARDSLHRNAGRTRLRRAVEHDRGRAERGDAHDGSGAAARDRGEARRTLAAWPEDHFNYRLAEVRQMLVMLDEAIADLRASAGARRFDLSLSASVDPLTIPEPLIPAPSPKEAIEAVLAAARDVDSSVERSSLLATALVGLERDKSELPSDWLEATRTQTRAAIMLESQRDAAYKTFSSTTMASATYRARMGDVRGLERLLERIQARDAALGGHRPETVSSLIAAVQERLDAARRLQLARDRWTMRQPAYRRYNVAIQTPIDLFAQLTPSLENIKALSGSTPTSLGGIERVAAQILKLSAAIVPPEEFTAAHALLVSAVQLANQAAQVRREATLAGDMGRAWDASSAAAGALMLGARARSDIQTLLRPPQLK